MLPLGTRNQHCMLSNSSILFLFLGLVALEVFEEFVNSSGVQEEAPAKRTCEETVTESAVSNSTCTSGLARVDSHVQQHQKLCKVSRGVRDFLVVDGQNSETLTWKGAKNSQRMQRDVCSLTSTMEKLVESAHFGKLGIIYF